MILILLNYNISKQGMSISTKQTIEQNKDFVQCGGGFFEIVYKKIKYPDI